MKEDVAVSNRELNWEFCHQLTATLNFRVTPKGTLVKENNKSIFQLAADAKATVAESAAISGWKLWVAFFGRTHGEQNSS